MLKIGVCCPRADAAQVLAAGFDYVELSASEMGTMDPWDPTQYLGLNIEATNLFFPGGISIWDGFPNGNYAMETAQRAQSLGTKIMVVGSGNQRRFSEDKTWPMEPKSVDLLEKMLTSPSPLHGFAQMIAYFQTGPADVIFAPESLNRSETNVAVDCGEMARVLASYGADYTADSYHLLSEWNANGREGGKEYPTKAYWIDQIPHLPVHVHLGDLPRNLPEDNDPMILGFFERLALLGYEGRVSLECKVPDQNFALAAERLRAILSK